MRPERRSSGWTGGAAEAAPEGITQMNKPTCMVLLLALACVRSGQTQNQNSAATGALSGLALKHTQAPDIHITPEAYRTQVVQEILRAGLPVRGSIQLQRMGDEAAVSLMKIFGGSLTLLTDTEKLTAVAILETAYGNPDTILNASD